MAKQNQPSSSGSSYSPSSASGGNTDNINFKNDTVISGNIIGPDDTFNSITQTMNPIPWPVADAADLKDGKGGQNGKSVIKLIEWLIQKVKEYLTNDAGYSFGQNFNITYHNHDINIPIPLSPFITDLDIQESHSSPYHTSNISLKIPFEHIQVMFRNGGGRLDPGGFIAIRQKVAPSLSDKIDNSRVKDGDFLSHLFTIENINYSLSADISTGNIITTLNLSCASFLSSLIAGQYVVSEATNVSVGADDPRLKISVEDYNARLDVLGVPANSPRRTKSTLLQAGGKRAGKRGDIIGEFFYDTDLYNKFLALVSEGSITRKHSGRDLKDLLTFLGYPKLPSSLSGEFDLKKWISAIEKDLDKGAVYYIRLLRTVGISEQKIKEIGRDLLAIFDNLTRNDARQGNFVERAPIMTPIEQRQVGPHAFNTTQAPPGDTTQAADNLKAELKAKNTLDGIGQFVEGIEQRIGDVVRVITSVQDLPRGIDTNNLSQFPWYASLSQEPLFNENLNKVSNLYSKGQTIWGACVSTFQPDAQTHELFPVVIPLLDDAWFKVANDFEKKLGGILCIIYRKKPMHPHINLSFDSINKEYREYRRTFDQKVDEEYYQAMTYLTDSELLGINQDKNTDIDALTLNNSFLNDKSKEYFAANKSIPSIPYTDVISIDFNHANSSRVNAVQVMHPYSQTQPDLGLLTRPYVNIPDASRYGLRFYQSNYPFMNLSPLEQGALNEGNTTAERLYMTLGDGSKYSAGVIQANLETTYAIKAGCWFCVDYSDKANLDFMDFSNDRINNFIAYCDSINYTFTTNQRTGNIICRTTIAYSRGSWGGIIPELPAYQTSLINKEEKTPKIKSPTEKRIVSDKVDKSKPGKPKTPVKAVEAVKPEVRFASDEWGSYGDAAAVARRNDAFGAAWSGLTPAEQAVIIKNQTATGEADGVFYDLDGDGFYEWVQVEFNYLHIPKDKRPKVEDYLFSTYQEILGPGFVSPYPSGYTSKPATKATATTPAVGSSTP